MMYRTYYWGFCAMALTFACDDAHKVGDEIALGGSSTSAAGSTATASNAAAVGGSSLARTPASNATGGALTTSGDPLTEGGSSLGIGGNTANASSLVGNGGALGSNVGGGATGVTSTGEASTGGTSTGVTSTGGTSTGGVTGVTSTGGTSTGGVTGVTSTGGTSTGGATSPQGGSAGNVATVDELCSSGTVKFEFTVDDPSLYCQVTEIIRPIGSFGGIEILTTTGQVVTELGWRDPCSWLRCATCNANCSRLVDPNQSEVTSEPKSALWDGSFDIVGACGIPGGQCYANRCAQPGRFVAKYCLAPRGDRPNCARGTWGELISRTACVEVPFEFPTADVVRGRITTGAAGGPAFGGAGGSAGIAGAPTNAGAAGSS